MSNYTYQLGIALSGGGARGFAHLGVLKALQEHGWVPQAISGVSAGAIVGAFVACEVSPDEIHEILKDKGILQYSKWALPSKGLLNLDGLEELIDKHIGFSDISELPKPLYVAAVNLNQGEVVYFDHGNIGDVVRASASIPLLFSPKQIDGDYYVDGGLLDNLPVKPLLDQCEKVIGVNLSPLRPVRDLESIVDISSRVFQLSVNSTAWGNKGLCDIWIEPTGLEGYDILNNKHADELYQKGYDYTRELLQSEAESLAS